jgi:phage terminase large subunit-like protein
MTFSLYDTIRMMKSSEGRDYAMRILDRHQHDWAFRRRPDQTPPFDEYWHTWILSGGRGAGKTRTGAEEADAFARAHEKSRLLLVGRTAGDIRATMVEGESGILSLHGGEGGVRYSPSIRQLEWPNGSKAFVTSADEPDSIRGVEAHFGWADEVAHWRTSKKKGKSDAWDNFRLAVRLRSGWGFGSQGRVIVTTSPEKTKALKKLHKELKADPLGVRLTEVSLYENAANISPGFLAAVTDMYEGTGLAETEVEGRWPWKL